MCFLLFLRYIAAFSNLARETNTIVLPQNLNDTNSMVAQAMAIYNSFGRNMPGDMNAQMEASVLSTSSRGNPVKAAAEDESSSEATLEEPSDKEEEDGNKGKPSFSLQR